MALNRVRGGQQTKAEFLNDEARRHRPWTEPDYIRLKLAVEALVRTHQSIDLPTKLTVPAFDGPTYYQLLEALDRTIRD
jgi:hypothetical protein